MSSLRDVFTPGLVADLAGPAVYVRGLGYQREGRVNELAIDGDRARATVRGSVPYTVELWREGRDPGWSCTCPFAEDGSLCKHAVAVALSLDPSVKPDLFPASASSATSRNAAEVLASRRAARATLADVVADMDRQRLVALVLEAAEADWSLKERLLAEARAARGQDVDREAWRARIDAVFAPDDDLVTYREAPQWAAAVEEVLDALEEVCDAGHPDAVAALAEHAHRRADQAVGYVDDSAGWLTTISQRLASLHLRACREGEPEPVALARRLFDLELDGELDGFRRAAETYAEVLGPEGVAEYRRLAAERWREVRDEDEWSGRRVAAREARVGVALASGDPDELIDVRRDDLRRPDDHLEIARSLVGAGRDDEAIDWARAGLDRYADRPWQTFRLRDFLAERLRARGDDEAAVDLYRRSFERSPSLGAYRTLLDNAGDGAGSERRRAIAFLRDRLADAVSNGRTRAAAVAGALIEILAYEGDIEAAWQVAVENGCDQRLWMTLARAREQTHPLDAIDVYEREVFSRIDEKTRQAYGRAVDLLARIRRLADVAGRPDRLAEILERVRAEHGRKRNLTALLDERGW